MITIKISIGEAIDRLSILIIKQKYIKDKNKLQFINKEIKSLKDSMDHIQDYSIFLQELIETNEDMWHCNEIRKQKIIDKNFEEDYIVLTIKESTVNDKRFVIKNKINELFNSELREQKSYNCVI